MVVVGSLVVVRSSGEVVSFFRCPRLVFQVDVIIRQSSEVAGNAPVDSLWVSPVLEVVVVRKDDYRVGASHEEVSPVFEASDDGQEFSVIDVIVSFGGVERLGVVSYQSFSLRSFVFLVQYCSSGECGGVNF